jgi:hypothetical protein
MKIVKVEAFNLQSVKEETGLGLERNATQAWKKVGQPVGVELEEFAKNYLAKHKIDSAYIVEESPVEDTRVNPYKIESITTTGARKYKTMYELINAETGEIMGRAEHKNEAIDLARQVVRDNREALGVGVKHYARLVKIVAEGEAKAFTFEYEPATNTKIGKFIAFGE